MELGPQGGGSMLGSEERHPALCCRGLDSQTKSLTSLLADGETHGITFPTKTILKPAC